MNISAINQKVAYQEIKKSGNVAFKGRYALNREISKQIAENSDPMVKFITKLGKNNGEILNTIVTAIGTAFVAPVFIAFNPFSKEDKETKTYSALRQPISAVLALAMQIGVNSKFNQALDRYASTGQLDRANLTAKPQFSHLRNIIKLEKTGLKTEEIENIIEQRQDAAFWSKVESMRADKNLEIKYSDLVDPSSYKKAEEQIKKEMGPSFFVKGKKISASRRAQVMDRAAKNIEAELKEEAKVKLRVGKMQESGISYDEILKDLHTKSTRIQAKIDSAKDGTKAKEIYKNAHSQLNSVLEKLENSGGFGKGKAVGKSYEEILHNVKVKKLVKAQINNSEAVLKSYKKWGGIFISLATLPLSCGLLNWAYPRIMEKLMPDIANAKKAKEAK